MKAPGRILRLAALPVVILSWTYGAEAAVPAEYKGTPYLGTPQAIPGRVDLANLDEGGLNVAFFADHRRDNAVGEGYAPISGDDHRPGNLGLPNICKTNRAVEKPGEGSEDFWEDGKRYPSDAKPYEYYMGYAHTVDWVRVTVNVQQAGKYDVSSNWACESAECGFSIWFNDGVSGSDNAGKPLDGKNKSGVVKIEGTKDYHKWRAYPKLAQVELTAGPQVMTFHVEVANHLQYGFLQFDLVGGNPSGGAGGSDAGGASVGGSNNAGSGGALGAGGTAGSVGAGGMTGTPPAGSAGTGSSAAGAPSGTAGASAAGAGSVGTTEPTTDSGCALATAPGGARMSGSAGVLLLGAVTMLRRRRARRI